nr:uncharacterized protein LOC105332671 isoform X5 [Crassostrea gigas]
MRNCAVFLLCLITVKTEVYACDDEELSRHLYNATLQENCYQNATSCQSTCTSGHVLENGSQTTIHVCNGTSWIPNTVTCLPARTPVMTTNFTIVYVTEDQPAGNCLYGFNVRMWKSISSFRNAIRSTCGELETGSISIENLELSPLAFQVNVVFHVKFSGEGTETSRDICMDMIEIISNGNQNYLKPFSNISCGASHSAVTKKQTTRSAAFEYNCTEMLGSQPLASSGGVRCVHCFPGNYLNSTRCKPCLQGTYQAVPGQLTCDVCPTGKHVTEDRTKCLDSVCVSTFLSQKTQNIDLTCTSENQMCMSTCSGGYIQDDGGLSTVYNCSGEGWFPPLKSCIKYEYSTYNVDLEAVYTTNDAVAATCLSQFQAFTSAHRDYFQTNISTSCSELHDGNVTIENITIGSIAFQIKMTFHLKFYGSWPTKIMDVCMDIIKITFQSRTTYLHPYTVLQCTDGRTNVTKVSAQRSGDVLNCPDGRLVINSTEASYCIPCSAGTFQNDLICLPCPNGTYQPIIGQTFCQNCSDWTKVNEDRTECRLEEITTLGNISYAGSSPPTEVTLLPNVTEQSTELTTTEQTITTDLAETKETKQNVLTSISTILSTSVSLTTTVVTIETTETSTEKSTSSSPTTTALRTTKGYTIPCGLDQLSSAIPNSKYTCAAHNQTCTVECSSGYVTSEGEASVEYRCEGDVWTPNRKLCLEYDIPFTTIALYTTYSTVDQIALSCLQDFREITERNKDLFQKTITDYCGDLGINAGGLKIENITSISLPFQITNTILITFYEESVDVREVCLDYITLIFLRVPSLLMPYSRLNCTSGLSDVTKVSASHGSPSYSCNNRTYLVNRTSQVYCVPCAPGMYMVSSQCVPCPEGHYQPLPGQLTCEPCTENRTVVDSGTNCTGYTIPCDLDQLSSAIPNSKYTCAAHNQTCTVECSSGYVTSEGEASVEYRCEGDVWTPNRKICLEYDIPFTTIALYTTYSTVDQVALSCLQDFREITERNKELFQKTITDFCGDLGINAGGLKIENITSISLPFQITNTILITFYEESVDVREVCLDYITLIFLHVPSLLMPYSRLNCTSGLSDVTKVSASHGSPSYSCNNRTYLVNRTSQVYCVPCAPGMYMVSSQCVPCPEGHYQPLPGQLTCEPCTENRTVVDSGTNCTGYTIPCDLDQLSSAIPNSKYTCAAHNQTCTVECSSGYVTSEGEASVEYRCEGDVWTPNRKICLEYDIPFTTSALYTTYSTVDQVALSCLQDFREITERNKDLFQKTITDYCGDLGINAGGLKIENITSISLPFQITNTILITFYEESVDVREVCLDYITLIFLRVPSLLMPYSRLNCTSGLSDVTKVSASHGSPSYSCNNRTYLVNRTSQVYCVPCAPGMYMVSSQCVPCPEGHYQPLPGQLTCEPCTGNRTVVDSGTNCTDYTIPCDLDQLSSAIPNSKYTCAAHNQTCTVECSSGYVTSEGEASVEYRCEGDVWTPNRKICLEYDIPFTTIALYTTYSTVDQVALSCLQDFREITERNKELFQKTITDYCGDLGINAGGLKIENITSISLPFQITNTILITFYEESVDVREVCLDYITLIFLNVPSLLMPYFRLNCTSGLSDVTKVSASHGSPSYSCNNRSYLVNRSSQVYCVPCAPGMYMVSSQCVPCPEGHYQPLPGQLTCEPCTENRTVVESGTNCTGYTIPCGLDQLSSAIPNSKYTCAAHNQTCTVECSSGYVTSEGEASVEYRCEGDVWTPNRKLCLEYDIPFTTSALYTTYSTVDQVALSCLQDFREITERNKDLFQKTITDYCGDLGINAGGLKIENITSISLSFQITNTILITFYEESVDVREVCLDYITLIFLNVPSLLMPYSRLNCTSGLSDVTKVSASHGSPSYSCNNRTYLVNRTSQVYCVPCAPGMYMISSKCVPCPEGHYQPLPGQLTCEPCTENRTVVESGTNCTEIVDEENDFNLRKSQVGPTGLTETEIIVIAAVSVCVVFFLVVIATVYYCKKSKAKRRTSHADVPGDAKSGDGVSVKSDEYLRGSHEGLIPGKSGSTNDPKWTYRDEKIIEKSTFASANEAKALDVLNTIIDINIDNEECITAQPPVCENVREGKWRPLHVRHKNESNVAVVINKAKETEPDKAPCRTLSDYDNFQIYVPEPEPSDPD